MGLVRHSILALFILGKITFAADIPHENKEFVEKLSQSMESLEKDFMKEDGQTSRGGKLLSALLKSFLKEKIVTINYSIQSLENFPQLKEKLNKVKKIDGKLTVADLLEMVKNDFKGLADDEKEGVKNQLIALLLSELKQKGKSNVVLKDKIQAVVLDYLQASAKINPNQQVPLSEELKKQLGLEKEASSEAFRPENIIKKIKEKGLPNEKAGMDLLSNLVGDSLNNVESLDAALEPIYKGLYDSLLEVTPNKMAIPQGGFNGAMGMINQLRNSPTEVPSFDGKMDLSPIQGHGRLGGGVTGSGGINPNELPEPVGGASRFGRGVGAGGSGKIPTVMDSEELKACLDAAKKQRFNVELKLPGALCASTPVSINPKAELESIQGKAPGEVCSIKLATAVHCIEGMRLEGRTIGTKIEGRSINATVLQTGSIGGGGTPVENGNPDLAMIIASVPCSEAAKVHFARVPSQSEVQELIGRQSLPVIMQQNSEINASVSGTNAATIAAQGSFEEVAGRVGNFLRFNSNSRFNEWLRNSGDSGRIRQGDSGGTALTCKMSGTDVLDYLYLGAISHIDVRGDKYEGTVGGVASGQSLIQLSQLMNGASQNRNATQHARSENDDSLSRIASLDSTSARKSASTHDP